MGNSWWSCNIDKLTLTLAIAEFVSTAFGLAYSTYVGITSQMSFYIFMVFIILYGLVILGVLRKNPWLLLPSLLIESLYCLYIVALLIQTSWDEFNWPAHRFRASRLAQTALLILHVVYVAWRLAIYYKCFKHLNKAHNTAARAIPEAIPLN